MKLPLHEILFVKATAPQFVSNFSDSSVGSFMVSCVWCKRVSRIFCPKAVKLSIGIIIHLKYILSCRFAQRNNLIMLTNRYEAAVF